MEMPLARSHSLHYHWRLSVGYALANNIGPNGHVFGMQKPSFPQKMAPIDPANLNQRDLNLFSEYRSESL